MTRRERAENGVDSLYQQADWNFDWSAEARADGRDADADWLWERGCYIRRLAENLEAAIAAGCYGREPRRRDTTLPPDHHDEYLQSLAERGF